MHLIPNRFLFRVSHSYPDALDNFAALDGSAHDAMVDVSAALRTLAGALMKIANDVRVGTGGAAAEMLGNDHARALAVSQGNFGLSVYKPVVLHNVLESIQLLSEAARSFNDRCARGIEPNEERIRQHLDDSLMLVMALNPHIGYEKAARISLKAYREGLTLREAALKLGFLTAEQFDEWVRPEDMTHPLAPGSGQR